MSAAVFEFRPEPIRVAWPWHLRGCDRALPDVAAAVGDRCRDCGQDVAVPSDARPGRCVCLYCGMDRGLVELVEVEPEWGA